jgi:ElaB/YqjD/DUF883 family membrane-anchored ribosome-binding protein
MGRVPQPDDFDVSTEMTEARTAGTEKRREGLMANVRKLGGKTLGKARSAAAGAGDVSQEVSGRVVHYVRENPWPTLLIGAGAAWLAVDAVRGRSDTEIDLGVNRNTEAENRRSMLRRSVSTVADASRGAGEQVTGFVRENPMWAGLAALGIGMAVGMTLPSTITENRMLGETRDTVVRKARQVANGAAETVREVAKSAGRVAGAARGA